MGAAFSRGRWRDRPSRTGSRAEKPGRPMCRRSRHYRGPAIRQTPQLPAFIPLDLTNLSRSNFSKGW